MFLSSIFMALYFDVCIKRYSTQGRTALNTVTGFASLILSVLKPQPTSTSQTQQVLYCLKSVFQFRSTSKLKIDESYRI